MFKRQPVLFIGHGAPMNATRDNDFTRSVTALGLKIDKPKAILVISAHWETSGIEILATEHPEKINDFFGHHPELHALSYSPQGAPELARRVQELVGECKLETSRGLDHGVWSPV